MPFTTHDSIYSENEDSYYTANDGNNDYIYNPQGVPDDYPDEHLPELMFPYSTKLPPPKVVTYMPINPENGEEGTDEVRYNEKVASYGLDYHPQSQLQLMTIIKCYNRH